MRTFIALQTIKINGKYIAPGDPFDTDAKEGARLISLGAARLDEDVEAGGSNGQQHPDVIEQIVAVIDTLNPDTDFTANNVPKVPVLAEKLKFDVSAAQRDEAFVLFNERKAQA